MDLLELALICKQAGNIDTLDQRSLDTLGQVARLRRENEMLKVRVAALIRLLVERGVFSAEDFSRTVGELEAQLAARRPQPPRAGAKKTPRVRAKSAGA